MSQFIPPSLQFEEELRQNRGVAVLLPLRDALLPPQQVVVTPPMPRRRATRELRAELFREAAAVVQAEFASHLTVEQVARRVATSPRQVRRAFSEAGETSFRSYLTAVRMARAAELLTSTDLSVSEVGRRVGYRQPGQFSKAFRRFHGEVPGEFRSGWR